MKRTKILAILLAASLASTALTGCTGYKPGPSKETTAASETSASQPGESASDTTESTAERPDGAYMDVVNILCEKCGFTLSAPDSKWDGSKTVSVKNDDPSVVPSAAAAYRYMTEGGYADLRIQIYGTDGAESLQGEMNYITNHAKTEKCFNSVIGDTYAIWSDPRPGAESEDGEDRWFMYGYFNYGKCFIKVLIETHKDFDASAEWYKEVDNILKELRLLNPMSLHEEYKKLV